MVLETSAFCGDPVIVQTSTVEILLNDLKRPQMS